MTELVKFENREYFGYLRETPTRMEPEQIIETWEINNRINLYLLNAIAEEHLDDQLASKGRSVGKQFAHIHNVRLMWLKVAEEELLAEQTKFEAKDAPSKQMLATALEKSSRAITELLRKGIMTGKIKGFRPHPAAFLGYMLAHESHHRSQIIVALKQSGHPVDQKVAYGIWEWGVR